MLTQILVSDETLAEVFVETDAELAFQRKAEDQGAMAIERKVTALFDSFPNDFSSDFKKTAETRFSQATAQIAYTESQNAYLLTIPKLMRCQLFYKRLDHCG